jgi:hypothetical protein
MNTYRMSIAPKVIHDLLNELEASKQSRLRAWNALQRLRSVLSEVANVSIPASTQKTFVGFHECQVFSKAKPFALSVTPPEIYSWLWMGAIIMSQPCSFLCFLEGADPNYHSPTAPSDLVGL